MNRYRWQEQAQRQTTATASVTSAGVRGGDRSGGDPCMVSSVLFMRMVRVTGGQTVVKDRPYGRFAIPDNRCLLPNPGNLSRFLPP